MGEIIAKAVKKYRIEMGWSKTELSKRTGISIQLLCDIEAGRRKPSLDNLVILAKTLNFSLDKIFLAKCYA